jgi:hypothetical protein
MPFFSSQARVRLGRMRQEAIARAVARLPRSAFRFIPGTSRRFGPPRRSASIQEYLSRHPGEWRPVLAAQPVNYPHPRALPKDAALLERKFSGGNWPELGVAVVPDGRVLDDNAWPVGRDDTFLQEFAFLGERPICPIFLIRRLSPPIRLAGAALNLGSCWAPLNYGHFVMDALPRLELFLRAGFDLSAVDHVVIPHFRGPSADRLVAQLGLPAEKIIRPERGTQYAFDVLYQPSYPGTSAYYHPLVPEFYRRDAATPQRKRRLYVPRRGGTRAISNEADVENVLKAHGFEAVDFRKGIDDRTLFAEAEIVAGPHGAGLANIVFCQPGAKLIELIPSNHVYPFYYSAACAAGVEYWGLTGPAEGPELKDDFAPPNDANFRVDPAELESLLTMLAG